MRKDLDTKIQAFWRWFETHAEELYDEFDPALPLFHQLVLRLRKVHPKLALDVSSKVHDRRELIVTADGAQAAFPTVMAMVEAAPKMKQWRVRGFRPRREGHLNIVIDGMLIETTNMFYRIKPGGEKVDVQVWYIEPGGLREQHQKASGVVLTNLLGEYVYVTRVRRVSVHVVDQERDYPDLKPIVEIARAFEEAFGGSN